jgi:hypothetical protein
VEYRWLIWVIHICTKGVGMNGNKEMKRHYPAMDENNKKVDQGSE